MSSRRELELDFDQRGPPETDAWRKSLVGYVMYLVGRMLLYGYLRVRNQLRFHGLDNVPDGPVVLACNHASYMDPVLVSIALAKRGGPVHWMAWDVLFEVPVLGFLIRKLGAFPVRPGAPDRRALREAERILRAGGIVGIFPEGGRTPTGAFQGARPGFVGIARRARASIVPVVIEGSYKAWPMQRLLPGQGNISVRFMPAIYGGEPLASREERDGVLRRFERLFLRE